MQKWTLFNCHDQNINLDTFAEYSESWLLTTLQYYNLGLWWRDIQRWVERMRSQPNPRRRERKKVPRALLWNKMEGNQTRGYSGLVKKRTPSLVFGLFGPFDSARFCTYCRCLNRFAAEFVMLWSLLAADNQQTGSAANTDMTDSPCDTCLLCSQIMHAASTCFYGCSACMELWLNVLLFIQAADLTIQLSAERLKTTPAAPKSFGTVFTDHMLTIEWSKAEGWGAPHIEPFGNLSMHPACSSLHYGIQVPQAGPLFILRITACWFVASALFDYNTWSTLECVTLKREMRKLFSSHLSHSGNVGGAYRSCLHQTYQIWLFVIVPLKGFSRTLTSCLKAWRRTTGRTSVCVSSGPCSTWSACPNLPKERVCLWDKRVWGWRNSKKMAAVLIAPSPPLSLRLLTSPSCWSASGDWWRSSRTGLFCQNHHHTSTSDQHLLALR